MYKSNFPPSRPSTAANTPGHTLPYHSANYLWPVGFVSRRRFSSYMHPDARSRWSE